MLHTKTRKILLPALLPLSCASSSWDSAKREDYSPVVAQIYLGNIDKALREFPEKEKMGFITTLEKGWFETLAHEPHPEVMSTLGAGLESRKTLHISDETISVLYKETADGYFPAEHETILFHIVTAMQYLEAQDCQGAAIEARRAARFLEVPLTQSPTRDFDDAAIRLWLASIWLSCDDWQMARVNLRVAATLSDALKPLLKEAEKSQAPKHLSIAFTGWGPDVIWSKEGGNNVSFVVDKQASGAAFQDRSGSLQPAQFVLPTYGWYERHQDRNHLLHEVLQNSRYAVTSTSTSAASAAVSMTGNTMAVAVGAVGIASGAGIAAGGTYLAYTNLATLHELSFTAAVGSILGGVYVAARSLTLASELSEGTKRKSNDIAEQNNPSASYRYVRFLPASLSVSIFEESPPLFAHATYSTAVETPIRPFLKIINTSGNSVSFFHVGSDMNSMPPLAYSPWRDIMTGNEFILALKESSYALAKEVCAQIPTSDAEKWKVANWEQLTDAIRRGYLASETRLQQVKAQNIWTSSSNVFRGEDDRPTCRRMSMIDLSENPSVDCNEPAIAVCVHKLKK